MLLDCQLYRVVRRLKRISQRNVEVLHSIWSASLSPVKENMNGLDILGLVATVFTTSSFVPQVWTTWKSKDVSGISLPTYLIITIGLFLWLVYGILKGDMPLMVANAVMVVLTAAITIMKIAFGKRPR